MAQLRPEGIETRKMSGPFVALEQVRGARVTGRIKMAEHSVWYQYIYFWYFVVKMSFWTFIMWQMESRESLEGIFLGGLINRGKQPSKRN